MRRTDLAVIALVCAGLPAGARAEGEVRTPNDAAQQAGLDLVRSLGVDFDGDGQVDTLGACRGQRGLKLCVFGRDAGGAVLRLALPWAGGSELKSIEARDLNPKLPGQEVLLEVYDETPDEKVKRIRIYSGYPQPREIFTSVIFRAKDEGERPEWEQPGVVAFGDARPGWYFWDTDHDGVLEIFVRRRAQLLKVPRAAAGPARLLTGVREAVYRWQDDSEDGGYREVEKDRFRDFLPAYEVATVSGSGAFIPEETLSDLHAEALAAAVYAATEGAPVAEEVSVDRAAFFRHGADKDLSTAWIEDDAKGDGRGEWLELTLKEAASIHMVRVVGGCVDDQRTFSRHNAPEQFEVRFDSGERAIVDLAEPERPDGPAIAVLLAPLPGRPFARQALVFFDGKIRSERVRITLQTAKRQGRANHTCISEVSVH